HSEVIKTTVSAVAFSQDDTRIVSGSRGSTIRQWDTETGQPVESRSEVINYGTQVVSGSVDRTIQILSLDDVRDVMDKRYNGTVAHRGL
ncbi:hypothetical protein PIIN_09987, partial [Serendipita indica DSM 11827]